MSWCPRPVAACERCTSPAWTASSPSRRRSHTPWPTSAPPPARSHLMPGPRSAAGTTCRVTAARLHDEAIVALTGEFDIASRARISREVAALVSTDVRLIVVDLAHTTFLDGAALAELRAAADASRRAGAMLLVRGAHGEPRLLIE